MNNTQYRTLCLLFALLTGCATKAPGDPIIVTQAPPPSKYLENSWTAAKTALVNWSFEYSNHTIVWHYQSGGGCSSDATASFDMDKRVGQLAVSNSVEIESAPGMPPCNQFDGMWDYTILVDDILRICKPDFCTEFE